MIKVVSLACFMEWETHLQVGVKYLQFGEGESAIVSTVNINLWPGSFRYELEFLLQYRSAKLEDIQFSLCAKDDVS